MALISIIAYIKDRKQEFFEIYFFLHKGNKYHFYFSIKFQEETNSISILAQNPIGNKNNFEIHFFFIVAAG